MMVPAPAQRRGSASARKLGPVSRHRVSQLTLFGIYGAVAKRFSLILWAVVTVPLILVGFLMLLITGINMTHLHRQAMSAAESTTERWRRSKNPVDSRAVEMTSGSRVRHELLDTIAIRAPRFVRCIFTPATPLRDSDGPADAGTSEPREAGLSSRRCRIRAVGLTGSKRLRVPIQPRPCRNRFEKDEAAIAHFKQALAIQPETSSCGIEPGIALHAQPQCGRPPAARFRRTFASRMTCARTCIWAKRWMRQSKSGRCRSSISGSVPAWTRKNGRAELGLGQKPAPRRKLGRGRDTLPSGGIARPFHQAAPA